MRPDVSIAACPDYSRGEMRRGLEHVLAPLGGLDWVTPGMTVASKANLVTAMDPGRCAITHPALLSALVELLAERGARVVVGDSPAGCTTPGSWAGCTPPAACRQWSRPAVN